MKSSHLSEGLAAALGFRTHAALLTHIREGGQLTFADCDVTALSARLRQLGYETSAVQLPFLTHV